MFNAHILENFTFCSSAFCKSSWRINLLLVIFGKRCRNSTTISEFTLCCDAKHCFAYVSFAAPCGSQHWGVCDRQVHVLRSGVPGDGEPRQQEDNGTVCKSKILYRQQEDNGTVFKSKILYQYFNLYLNCVKKKKAFLQFNTENHRFWAIVK